MSRAPLQVLVFPYRVTPEGIRYAVFRRTDGDYWQAIAGGGDEGETPLKAAQREALEEAGLNSNEFLALDSLNTVPVVGVCGYLRWGPDVLVVPEHCFGVDVRDQELVLSHEHTEYRWVDYDAAVEMLHWDSNKNALWELNHRLTRAEASKHGS